MQDSWRFVCPKKMWILSCELKSTHVTKCGWFPILSSSLSRKVRSVASPGLRHSSSCRRFISHSFKIFYGYSLFKKRLVRLSGLLQRVHTSMDMIPLCFSSTRSQMILLLKNCTDSHWGKVPKTESEWKSIECKWMWKHLFPGSSGLPRYPPLRIPPAQTWVSTGWKAAAASRCNSLYRTAQNCRNKKRLSLNIKKWNNFFLNNS